MDALLIKSKDPSSLLPDELSYIVSAFLPSQSAESRSKAYLVLSALCQGVRASKFPDKSQAEGDEPDQATLALCRIFQPLIASNLSQSQEDALLEATAFHCALFQVDWKSALQIFTGDGFMDLLTTLEVSTSLPLSLTLARLYAQACSHKPCRQIFSEESIAWLQKKSSQTTDDASRVVAILAIVKLAHGASQDAAAIQAGSAPTTNVAAREHAARAAQLSDMITKSKDIGACLNEAVEGLAYLSIKSVVKKNLANSAFLKRLFSFVPKRRTTEDTTNNNSTLIYGVLVIISNLCAYKPRLSQEQQQIAKLRRMAESGKQSGKQGAEEPPDPLESESEVQARCRVAISCGALDVLSTASALDSHGIRCSVGQVLLSLAENKENRGEILKGGGSKTLTRIIQSSSSSPELLPQEALPAIQALVKLAITAPPIQVFGPNEGSVLDAIRPFSQLLLHPSASMLQQFEAMMALTNLASHSPNFASRVANTPHLLSQVELLMLEDHTLLRRAATELICNLVAGSENTFERYAGAGSEMGAPASRDGASKTKIHVLLAMSDVEDLPTRLAASGALAMLTSVQTACEAIFDLQTERHRAFVVLAQLVDPDVHAGGGDEVYEDSSVAVGDPGLVHRGVVCIRNLLSNLQSPAQRDVLRDEVRKAGFLVVFAKLLKGELGTFGEAVIGPADETMSDDPSFLALSARLRGRIDNAFSSVACTATRSTSEDSAGGFIVEDTEPPQYEAGGFIVENLTSTSYNAQSYIPLQEIPRALNLLDLSSDDEIMGVFRNAASGWGARNSSIGGVSRKDWRAVCAALLEGEDDSGSDEENLDEDVEMGPDSGPDSDEYQMEEPPSEDATDNVSSDEYEEPTSAARAKKAPEALARTPAKRSGTEMSRRLSESEKAQCRQAFSRFFPDVPDDQLDHQRIMIKHIARIADILKENLKTEEILEMLEAFSTSPDKSMSLTDFERMMIVTKLV